MVDKQLVVSFGEITQWIFATPMKTFWLPTVIVGRKPLLNTSHQRNGEKKRRRTHAEPNISHIRCLYSFPTAVSVSRNKKKTRMMSNFTAERLSFPWFDIICKKRRQISLLYISPQWDLMHSVHLIFWNTKSVQQQTNLNWARQEK